MKVFVKNNSALLGEFEGVFIMGDTNAGIPWDAPIIEAFMDDKDLQEITLCSSNLGFVKTLRKVNE